MHCSGDCSLHLEGKSDKNAVPIHSSSNAPGIIMGVGNVGLYLS